MYRIYCDNHLLYDGMQEDLVLLNPNLVQEVNKTSIFDFDIYPSHKHYDNLKRLKSLIKIHKDNKVIFKGRFIDDVKGFYNERKVTCEGSLSFLVDSIIRPYEYPLNETSPHDVEGLLEKFLNEHNSQVETDRQIEKGIVTVTDPNGYIRRANSEYQTTLDNIKAKLIDLLGGYLMIRYEADGTYLDYFADITEIIDQKVEFAVNLLDYKEKETGKEIYTGIIPLGATIEPEEGEIVDENEPKKRLTIESVNGGIDYLVNEEAASIYGLIFKTVTWDDVTEPYNLKNKAIAELETSFLMDNTVELSAVDLANTGIDTESFKIGTKIRVRSEIHGIDEDYTISKLTTSILDPSKDRLTLGKVYKSLTEQSGSDGVQGPPGETGPAGESGTSVLSYQRFYKLQEYNLPEPVKPTSIDTLPPDRWSSVEPAFTFDVETSLYTIDLNVFSDNTFVYSDVSLSASYEAAKEAYKLGETVSNELVEINSQLATKLDSDGLKLAITEVLSDGTDADGIGEIVTSTGFTFTKEGMTVLKKDAPTKTVVDEDGMKVRKTDGTEQVMLSAGAAGVDAVNLRASTYLIIGNRSRFEDYGDSRTGCFWIGG